jgi:chromosomal replication initiator protein
VFSESLMQSTWQEVKKLLKSQIPGHSFRMWIEPLELKSSSDARLVLSAPNFFSRKRVLDQYGASIETSLKKQTGKKIRLMVDIANGARRKRTANKECIQLKIPKIQVRPHSGRILRREFTFDQFVVGANNDFAYSASLSLASKKLGQQNSLFLLARTGMGKSHLSQAIGHHILAEHPSDQVYYITAEDFTNEMVDAFRHDTVNAFKNKYRSGCDVLLLEDIHYLSGKERTQIELALTLDSLLEAGKKIIFSSCNLPADIPKLNDKLRSRLSSSLISEIDPPGFGTRVRILRKKAQIHGENVPDDVIQYLAGELTDDVRQLESGLAGVTAKSSLLGMPINLDLAGSVVKNIVRTRKSITIDVIKKLVCREYKVALSDMVSKSRRQCFVKPRQVAIYLSRKYTDAPLQAIGRSFKRYHATAMHSIKAVEREMKLNRAMGRQVDYLSKKLETCQY